MRNAYNILVGNPEGNEHFEDPRCRWEDNIKMYLKKVGCEDFGWFYLVEGKVRWRASVNTVMNHRFY
jgi:hypothetical protein